MGLFERFNIENKDLLIKIEKELEEVEDEEEPEKREKKTKEKKGEKTKPKKPKQKKKPTPKPKQKKKPTPKPKQKKKPKPKPTPKPKQKKKPKPHTHPKKPPQTTEKLKSPEKDSKPPTPKKKSLDEINDLLVDIKEFHNFKIKSSLKRGEVYTQIDAMLDMVNALGKIKINKVAEYFGVDEKVVETWARILEEASLIEVYYPAFGKIVLKKLKK